MADRFGLVFAANLPLPHTFWLQKINFLESVDWSILRSLEHLPPSTRRGLVSGSSSSFFGYALLSGTPYFDLEGSLLQNFLFNRKLFILGIGAFISYEALYFTSLASFRQRWYEIFLGYYMSYYKSVLWFSCFSIILGHGSMLGSHSAIFLCRPASLPHCTSKAHHSHSFWHMVMEDKEHR